MRDYVAWVNRLADHDEMARSRFVESPIVHPSVAMRHRALRRLGGYRDFDGPEDYDLWLRAFDAGLRFAKLPEVLLEWRDSPGRLTRTDPRYSPRALRPAQGRVPRPRRRSPSRPAVVWGAGPIGKAFARALADAGQRVAAFVEVDARKIGQRIHGAPVVGGRRGTAASEAPCTWAPSGRRVRGTRSARKRDGSDSSTAGTSSPSRSERVGLAPRTGPRSRSL